VHIDILGHIWKNFIGLNAMAHAFIFNMKTNITMNVIMLVMCRKILELLGKTIVNGGQP
jgi:hypothetical protein